MLLLAAAAPAQDAGLRTKEAELKKLRAEIEGYETKIMAEQKKESATLELIDSYDKQATLLRKLIRTLHDQEQRLRKEIDTTHREVRALGGQITFLKRHYAHHVSALYRYGRTYDLELLLSSASFNQMLVRSEYLRRFSDQRRKDVEKIAAKRALEEQQSVTLQRQLEKQRALIAEKAGEEKRLAERVKKRKEMLAGIRRDKKTIQRDAARAAAAARELEQLIAQLIEEERLRKEREAAARAREGKPPLAEPAPTGQSFAEMRGRLRWPVSQGKIAARFGNRQHPILRTITQNTGIDIALPAGTDVQCIAAGQVSTIHWLPSFGNLVIVDHARGYRTVYAHLAEITVTEGQQVGEGTRIGTSGEGIGGPTLHFEIWKDREKQDPELWLHPRGLSKR